MTRRFCPSDEELAEYLAGSLPHSSRPAVEEHLASCPKCRSVVSEAYDVLQTPSLKAFAASFAMKLKDNLWLLPSASFLALSFIFKRYFLQFLSASVICAVKWIIDSRATNLLIMINRSLREDAPESPARQKRISGKK